MANGETTLNTGGGASIGKNVQTGGGAFVGRDQTNITVINWISLGAEFIDDLNKIIQHEQKNQEKSEKEQKLGSQPDSNIQSRIDRLTQKVIEIEHFDWSKAEQAYLDKVIKLYDRVRIFGNSVDVPLGNLFTQVYILDKPTARQRHDINELRKEGQQHIAFQRQPGERIPGMNLVRKKQNLFILGKPGAGKTTFLKYITIQAARQQLSRIPIFVSLNQWADSKWGKGDDIALLPFIVEQFEICDFPDATLFIEYLLKTGRALVLFDGLDEVKQENEQRRQLIRLLQNFARQYNRSQHLITCRIAANEYAFTGFTDVEVADFTSDQVHEYARKWFSGQEKKLAAFIAELEKPDNQGLAELCNTPLLLSLLCLTFDNTIRFPPSRAELYEDALDTLLRKWDSSRQIQRDEIYRELSHKRKLQLLMRIAVPTFEKGELFFRQRDLEKWIVDYLVTLPGAPPADSLDGTVLLKAIEAQHSILVERAQSIYSFSHLTFQEYLTARYIAENHGSGVTNQLIRRRLTDRRWHEVFLLTASLLSDADEFINAMQSAVDDIVVDSSALYNLLTWADKCTDSANPLVEQQHIVRLAYIFLARDSNLDLALALARDFVHDFDLALLHAISLVLDLALGIDLDRARNSDRNVTLAQSIMYSHDLAHNLVDTLTPQVGFDYGLYYIWGYATLFASEHLARQNKNWETAMQQLVKLVDKMVILDKEAGLYRRARQLADLPIPLPIAHMQEWQQYADAVLILLCDKRELEHEWNFHHEDVAKLDNYFYANELLVQCLKVAAVADRQAVLQGLLRPPKIRKKK